MRRSCAGEAAAAATLSPFERLCSNLLLQGYSRLGAAHYGLREWDEAAEAYTKGEPGGGQRKAGSRIRWKR